MLFWTIPWPVSLRSLAIPGMAIAIFMIFENVSREERRAKRRQKNKESNVRLMTKSRWKLMNSGTWFVIISRFRLLLIAITLLIHQLIQHKTLLLFILHVKYY